MAAKLARLIHKIAIQMYLVAESCTICSSRSSPETIRYNFVCAVLSILMEVFWVLRRVYFEGTYDVSM